MPVRGCHAASYHLSDEFLINFQPIRAYVLVTRYRCQFFSGSTEDSRKKVSKSMPADAKR